MDRCDHSVIILYVLQMTGLTSIIMMIISVFCIIYIVKNQPDIKLIMSSSSNIITVTFFITLLLSIVSFIFYSYMTLKLHGFHINNTTFINKMFLPIRFIFYDYYGMKKSIDGNRPSNCRKTPLVY